MDSWVLKSDHLRLEEYLRSSIFLPAQLNLTPIRQYIIRLILLNLILLLIYIVSLLIILQLTGRLLDLPHDLKLRRRVELHPVFPQQQQ